MSANDLLIWMSARVEGSWQQFRSAVETFHVEEEASDDDESSEDAGDLPIYQALRLNLQRLAHVEFTSTASGPRWRVVPPSLVIDRSGEQYVGILCGARSPSLCASLLQLSGIVSPDSQNAVGMPARIRLVSSDPKLLPLTSKGLGLLVQQNAPAALLAAIPPVDDPRSRLAAEPPSTAGWTIHRFSAASLRWKGADPRDLTSTSTGLFRLQLRYQRFYFLCWRGRTFRVPVQVGKYVVLAHRRIKKLVWYERARAVLSVPVTCRPPLLTERALVLCSGLLPGLDRATGRLEYSQVPPDIARLAAALLRQEIDIR